VKTINQLNIGKSRRMNEGEQHKLLKII